jgi:glutathione synthase/RimK-type ligase-like ATP-grasp enzyme
MDVALVTCAALPGLHPDDQFLLRALRRAGVDAEPVVWEDRHQDWSEARLVVVRSAWDYSFRRDQFVAWAERTAERTTLWNSARVVRWNTHKSYLCDLAACGVPVVPTIVLHAGSPVSLHQLLDERGWHDAVVKAAVAQSGRYAMAVPRERRAAGQAHLDRLLPAEDMLVQPRIESIATAGELSVTFVDGVFTHAVRKRPAAGDFRVHSDYGGSVEAEDPSPAALAVAGAAIQAAGEPLHYGRVDLVTDRAGDPLIMEFEIVEPELFLEYSAGAVERFTASIMRELDRRTST